MRDITVVQVEEESGHRLVTQQFQSVRDIAGAYKDRLLTVDPTVSEEEIRAISTEAPNLTLNVTGNIINAWELGLWTALGTALQSLVIAFPAVATYYTQWPRKGVPVTGYAYWCFVSGTLAMVTGLLICGRVVEASTIEHKFRTTANRTTTIRRIVRLQMDCNVSSQQFPDYAILNESNEGFIRSRLGPRDQQKPKHHR